MKRKVEIEHRLEGTVQKALGVAGLMLFMEF